MNSDSTSRAPVRSLMNGKPVYTVPARSVLNLDSGFKHKLLCDGPTFSAGSACAYSCSFCYVEELMQKNPHWQAVTREHSGARFEQVVIRRDGAVAALRAQLTTARGLPKYMSPADERVVYGSPLVDVAANLDLVRETVEICKTILELTNWQIRLLSKSNLLPRIAETLAAEKCSYQKRVIYGVSTGTLDDPLAAAFERGTPKVSKRIESLHWLQDSGFKTYAMVCPSLPQPDAEAYAGFARAMSSALRYDRCEHVWAEVINLRGESFTRTLAALHAAGHTQECQRLDLVSRDKIAWEQYARDTFLAHAAVCPPGKLRFLQYVTSASRPWWAERQSQGAVLL